MTQGSPSGRLDSIREPVREECEALEDYFKSYLRTDVLLIDRIFEHLIDGGGKRFRPLLVLLVSSCSADRINEDVYKLAVAVEFIHTATLLHDDVVDQSDVRRGNRVAYRIWGAEPSVLSGDYLYSRAFNLLVEIGHLGILEALSGATTQMARGEVLQLLRSYSTATTREEYLEVIKGKTASLISAACTAAGYIAGLEGRNLPVIVLMENIGGDLKRQVGDIFLKGSPQSDDFQQILGLMEEHQVLEKTLEVAVDYRDRAVKALLETPEGPCRDSLYSLANYVVERSS
jgi:geranylgeranyl pyrophosphate synthase